MHVLIIGGGGMIGRKLSDRLARDGRIKGREIARLTLHDVVEPAAPAGAPFATDTAVSDLSVPGAAEALVADRPDVVIHLASVVSGEAEADFEKGYRVNLDGTRQLFEAIRAIDGYTPRLVFTSSVAAFGGPYPEDAIPDDFILTPFTSYGTQKAICELLLTDYTRRGAFDGIGIRLPTICVRPGKPNKAASGFFSGIIREPLIGMEALLPVSDDLRHFHASPRSAVGFLVHAAGIDGEAVGPRRNLTMPGVSVTVGEQIEALRRVAGEKAVSLIRREPDPTVLSIIGSWPRDFATRRADALGFTAEADFDAIIRAHIEDELGGTIAV
ncbi:SDR family oxidoreductase [Azospirillum sp. RWY-5-1]|uniref:SDR family oxidoreductase n=1 Tax=Azospirillum oleiclasticum TaxID=2735135 RepID=A0ABX2TMW8_9PROT|nr:D-erythronate dehydrogenase [Azospirillum oleiclasticum]NYZ17642.1 SDR family oxidoreductase [Azospirillum oleiclasticum]NYZ24997.1 SDR family oxidoreductase [Azospirillum oleiclasticum]